ncbi:MAG: hypothetical protein KF832_22760 [Caldilineaceae bacterium]|nr:hypothetical protein [Caldilineaceae bacterium]
MRSEQWERVDTFYHAHQREIHMAGVVALAATSGAVAGLVAAKGAVALGTTWAAKSGIAKFAFMLPVTIGATGGAIGMGLLYRQVEPLASAPDPHGAPPPTQSTESSRLQTALATAEAYLAQLQQPNQPLTAELPGTVEASRTTTPVVLPSPTDDQPTIKLQAIEGDGIIIEKLMHF